VLTGDRLNLVGIAADQDRIRHHPLAVGERDPALIADGDDRPHQMLVEPHAAGDAVHDDAELARPHDAAPVSCRVPDISSGRALMEIAAAAEMI
jgi:hypothetical protein